MLQNAMPPPPPGPVLNANRQCLSSNLLLLSNIRCAQRDLLPMSAAQYQAPKYVPVTSSSSARMRNKFISGVVSVWGFLFLFYKVSLCSQGEEIWKANYKTFDELTAARLCFPPPLSPPSRQ